MASGGKTRFVWLKRLLNESGYGTDKLDDIDRADQQYGTEAFNGGYGSLSLQGDGNKPSRTRQMIYLKWQSMLHDAVVSSIVKLLCTAALGGNESNGDVVFIEATPEAEKNPAEQKLVEEMRADLAPLLNRIAYSIAFNAVAFGDGYARIYPKAGHGVVDATVDEKVMPTMVQSYERGSATVGFVVYIGQKAREKLSPAQMVRMKMPRTIYTPQPLAVEMAMRASIAEDDVEKLPVLPSIAGGSLLGAAEEAYDRYIAALVSLVGKRAIGSIDAAWLKVNLQGMTKDQQDAILNSVENAQNYLKAVARQAVATKQPVLEPLRFLLPVMDEKQITALESTTNQETGQGYSVDDVMLHAKLLGGALGVDISMVGFAELISGGFGDGGYFRMSAQAAESARMIRVALDEAMNHIVDVHLLYKKKKAYEPGKRPWRINYWSTISALESERQKTRQDEMNAGSTLVSTLAQLKDLGLDKPGLGIVLGKLGLDDADKKTLAQSMSKLKPDDGFDGDNGGGIPLSSIGRSALPPPSDEE